MTLLRNALIGASALSLAACGAGGEDMASASSTTPIAAEPTMEVLEKTEHDKLFALFAVADEANLKLNPINALAKTAF